MSVRSAFLIFVVGVVTVSCSEKPAPESALKSEREAPNRESEEESRPKEDEIGEDCVAFVRATKLAPTRSEGADCPGCAADGAEVLAFREMRVDRISCSETVCDAVVTLRALFNPALAGEIRGGLTAWIPEQQKTDYQRGQAPQGEQVYRVKVVYKRTTAGWRAIEFDRANSP